MSNVTITSVLISVILVLMVTSLIQDTGSYELPIFLTKWGTFGFADGQLSRPHAITIDSDDNIYVVNPEGSNVQKFSSNGTFLNMLGRDGHGNGQFVDPEGVTVDSNDNLYVADTFNFRVQKFSSNGTFLDAWGMRGSSDGKLGRSYGITADSNDNIYVVDDARRKIHQFERTRGYVHGLTIQEYPRHGIYSFDSSDLAKMSTDGINYRIQKFSSNGTFLGKWVSNVPHTDISSTTVTQTPLYTFLGKWVSSVSYKLGFSSGIVTDHYPVFRHGGLFIDRFAYPSGMATDSNDNLYVAERGNHRILKLSSNFVHLDTWGAWGKDDGQLYYPQGIAVDSNDNLYVADGDNFRIQKFSSNGTFLGKWGENGDANGQFQLPRGIAVDSVDNAYVIDSVDHSIQVFQTVYNIDDTSKSDMKFNFLKWLFELFS